jgi:hypothetical protein
MSDVISYGGQPPGSRRVLELDLRRSAVARGRHPIVTVDGLAYTCEWGLVRLEIPADRATHLSVHIDGPRHIGAATAMVGPDQPAVLAYAAPANLSYPGALGAPGATKARGRGLQGCLLVGLALTLLLLIGFLALIGTMAFG